MPGTKDTKDKETYDGQPSLISSLIPEKLQNWLIAQGVSTVLLFTIIVLCWYGVPYIADKATDHIDKINKSNQENLQSIIKSYELDQERDEERNRRKDELLRELLQRNGFAGSVSPSSDLEVN